MTIAHNGTLMRIYVAEGARQRHQQTFRAIVDALAHAGLAGAIAFKGISGYGRRRVVSSERIVDATIDLPMLIEVVDEDEKIRGFMPTLESLVDDGFVTLERIQTIVYRTTGVRPQSL